MNATLSPDGLYRYQLSRELSPIEPKNTLVWIMLNPSTADATVDDPTIRKCIGFTQRFPDSVKTRFEVVNLYALRATDPRAVKQAIQQRGVEYAVGPDNDQHIATVTEGRSVVLAWGATELPGMADRIKRVREVLDARKQLGLVYSLGTAKNGQPRHPLMLGYNTPFELYA